MKIRANRVNLKKHARELLGNEYSPEAEKELIRLCTKRSTEDYRFYRDHISFAIVAWLSEIDKVLHTYGVESLFPEVNLDYCNMGDTYAMTIYHYQDKLWIGDWGSIVEEHSLDKEEEPYMGHDGYLV